MNKDEVRTRVRYGETDQMGVVYHSNYLRYFELGRTEYMRARGCAYSDLEKRGFFLAIVDATVRFRAGARYDDEIVIRTKIEDSSPVRVTFYYEVRKVEGDVLLAEGTTALACIDRNRKITRLPAEVINALHVTTKGV